MPLTGDEFAEVRRELFAQTVGPAYTNSSQGFRAYCASQRWEERPPATFADAYIQGDWREALRAWMESAQMSESLNFLEANDRYRTSPTPEAAYELYSTYVDPKAQEFVNVSASLAQEVRAAINAATGWEDVPTRGRSDAFGDVEDLPPPRTEDDEQDAEAPPLEEAALEWDVPTRGRSHAFGDVEDLPPPRTEDYEDDAAAPPLGE